MEAWRLLDLFHAGISRSENPAEREGPVQSIEGAVNLNTVGRDAIRALALGALTQDPKMALRSSESHNTTNLMAPPVTAYKTPAAELNAEAARIADAIIEFRRTRPFSSPSEIAEARDSSGRLVFGNRELLANGTRIHRSDSASEEAFARVYESTTVRSRNFRIWVIGQAVSPTTSTTAKPEVLAEVRRAFTVFADPGPRAADGTPDPLKSRLLVVHENDF
jgi:hypothetical protein